MRRFLIFFWGGLLLLLSSCNTKIKESDELDTPLKESIELDTPLNNIRRLDSTTNSHHRRHEISYTDNVTYNKTKLELDSLVLSITCTDTIVDYEINPITKKVLRICASKANPRSINSLLLDGNIIKWDNAFGKPNEFIGEYLFSNVYHESYIVKYKFKIADMHLQLIEKIPGGRYSEGAGTWEWFISNEGQHRAIIFHGADVWTSEKNKLLITPEYDPYTYLIDLHEMDTLLELPRSKRIIGKQLIMEDALLFGTESKSGLGYLQLYDLKGELKWETRSDYLEKIIGIPDDNLIIASGYFFSTVDTQNYFTVAYDKVSGQIKWSFPTSRVYDSRKMLTSRVNTSNLFRIAENLYGMVVGQVSLYFGENINHSNKLILFDKNGSIYETLNLSSKDQNYSVITSRENEFEIVSNYETRRFKIYTP